MANYCAFELRAKGTRENVEKFTSIMQRTGKWFFYGMYGVEEVLSATDEDGLYYRQFTGGCKWSIYTSLTKEGYYSDHDSEYGVCLEDVSKELNLDIEVFSEGDGYDEHRIVSKGETTLLDVDDYCMLDLEDIPHEPTDEDLLEFKEENFYAFKEYGYRDITPNELRKLMEKDDCWLKLSNMEWEFTI